MSLATDMQPSTKVGCDGYGCLHDVFMRKKMYLCGPIAIIMEFQTTEYKQQWSDILMF